MTEQAEQQAFWERLHLPPPGAAMPLAAYDALPETTIPMEYIHGRVVYPHWNETSMTPTPRPRHQLVVGEVYTVLRGLIPDGRLLLSPMDVAIGGQKVQPDVFWASAGGNCTRGEAHYVGAPDLAVEVLSPGNASHDRITKFDLYEQHGVREYWLLDPEEDVIEVYMLADGAFQRSGAYTVGDTFRSPLLQQTVTVSDLFDID
ncbi:MAG: Uma2 family endonuclease [Chloroflexota bacterium]